MMSSFLAPSARSTSSSSGSMVASPVATFTTIGKNEIRKAVSTAGTMPMPILIIWFGIGIVPAVLTAFLISFFPIVVNVATGLASMEPELEDVLRALGAKKLDIMLKVGIPRT